MAVLCDRLNALTYFATFMGMVAMEFFLGYLSLHLKKQFAFRDHEMGFMFSI